MLLWVDPVFKLINLTKWLNNQNHAQAMKIRQKIEKLNLTSYDRIFILDHEETCLIQFWDVFHEIWLKMFFYNLWWKSLSHGVQWKKKFEVWWKNALCFEKLHEKFEFSYLEKFSHFTNFDEMKNLENSNKILASLENLKQTLTLGLSFCYPKLKYANEDHGVENEGLYRKDRQRVTQESPNKWFIILRKH